MHLVQTDIPVRHLKLVVAGQHPVLAMLVVRLLISTLVAVRDMLPVVVLRVTVSIQVVLVLVVMNGMAALAC